jgi:hypothetical protein
MGNVESLKWIRESMTKVYPPGVLKDIPAVAAEKEAPAP